MVSNALHEVTRALDHPDIIGQFIHFPRTLEEIEATIAKNEQLGMPGVLGFIDGTLVRIVTPSGPHKQVYRSRKGFTAINTQVVCDADLMIMNVNARFPGSSNDPYIFRASGVRRFMVDTFRERPCWLLGDSAYPYEPWMMLPLPNAIRPSPEYYYNKLHCHCRNAAERCMGVLKARWRCLLCDRVLHYAPPKAGCIINACAVLHNYLIRLRAPAPQPIYEDLGQDHAEEQLPEDFQLMANADQIMLRLINYAYERNRRLHADD